jgi:Zn-dependent protease
MNHRQNALFWSFPIGTWYRTRVRVSWLFPLLCFGVCYKLGLPLGSAVMGILFVSTLLHEFGHVIVARAVDGTGDEVLIWPLGGLAFVDAPNSTRAQVFTAAGGPLINFFLCIIALPFVLKSDYSSVAFNPLQLPMTSQQFGLDLVNDLLVLTFTLNWMSLLINLIPAYPLDGGRVARSLIIHRLGAPVGVEVFLRLTYASAFVLAIVALCFADHMLLLCLAFTVAILAMQESMQIQAGEAYEDSFMGYDFSQGYTSLERSERKGAEPSPGLIQRWRERRRAEKRKREELQQQEVETKLDFLLAKVHEQGIDSLTEAEKRQLRNASDRYRSRGKEQT